LGDKVPAAERGNIESALSDLKTALASDDKDIIEKKAQALEQAFGAVAQQAYAQAQPGEAGAGANAGATGGGGAKDDVLDAEFEEVKDKKKGT
jgi:molecular chaperone DnaK